MAIVRQHNATFRVGEDRRLFRTRMGGVISGSVSGSVGASHQVMMRCPSIRRPVLGTRRRLGLDPAAAGRNMCEPSHRVRPVGDDRRPVVFIHF